MKNSSKRLLVAFLAICMVGSAFTGCKKDDNSSSEADSSNVSSQPADNSTDSSSAGSDESQDFYDQPSYSGDTVKLQFYIDNQNPFGDWRKEFIKDKTGVELEIVVADSEKTNAMLSAGNLPDIGNYAVSGDLSQAIKAGYLVDMSDKLDKLPNVVKNAPNAIQYAMDEKSDGTGKLYGIPRSVGLADIYAVDTTTYAMNIRWDIYREAGFPEVTSFDTMLDALKKMQDVHPTAEDGTKMYAFELSPESDKATNSNPWSAAFRLYGMSGFQDVRGFLVYDIQNDELKPILDEDSQFMNAVRWFWKANQLGLISPESKTQKNGDVSSKLLAGYTLTATPGSYYRGYNTDERINAEEPIGIYPISFEGMCPTVPGESLTGDQSWMYSISEATKDVDACLRVIDLFYNEDACLTLYNSPKGELWDIVDGEVVATDDYTDFYNNSTYTLKNGEVLETGKFFFAFGLHTDWEHTVYGKTMRQSEWPEATELMTAKNGLIDLWAEHNPGYSVPSERYRAENTLVFRPAALSFTRNYDDDIAITAAAVGEQIITYAWNMIYASTEEELNSLYNELVDKCNQLGIEECVKWGQEMWADAEALAEKYSQ
ncbi:hypothetical protein [Bianquea renquensis]|uniref:Extracellular solute-binding protein n=1 Tax=Bianquea renquensis TaxID=2763661 RepID=A0A926I1N8_9FIRM|nr:hypothetical protein [Bianquea renquensis]MBC8543633.1 hypothetical protein [Bianquea renquensis]